MICRSKVCKTGPPIPYSTTLKNVLIVGDSVSIGYTPFVAELLAAEASVQVRQILIYQAPAVPVLRLQNPTLMT